MHDACFKEAVVYPETIWTLYLWDHCVLFYVCDSALGIEVSNGTFCGDVEYFFDAVSLHENNNVSGPQAQGKSEESLYRQLNNGFLLRPCEIFTGLFFVKIFKISKRDLVQ